MAFKPLVFKLNDLFSSHAAEELTNIALRLQKLFNTGGTKPSFKLPKNDKRDIRGSIVIPLSSLYYTIIC